MHCVDVCVDVWVYDGVWKLGCGVYLCIRKLHTLWVFLWVIRVILVVHFFCEATLQATIAVFL